MCIPLSSKQRINFRRNVRQHCHFLWLTNNERANLFVVIHVLECHAFRVHSLFQSLNHMSDVYNSKSLVVDNRLRSL